MTELMIPVAGVNITLVQSSQLKPNPALYDVRREVRHGNWRSIENHASPGRWSESRDWRGPHRRRGVSVPARGPISSPLGARIGIPGRARAFQKDAAGQRRQILVA